MFPQIKKSKKPIYLDHAATTYLDPAIKRAMEPFWSDNYGNPSSLYQKGREASLAIESARKTIAAIIGAKPSEIVFTAGGTESVNLAIFGVAKKYLPGNGKRSHFLASAIEHHAVLHSFEALNKQGYTAQTIGVTEEGVIDIKQLQAAIRPETVFISIMYANNEIGTVQPIMEIGQWLKAENKKRLAQNLPRIIFHTDACQAAGSLDLNVQKLGVDLMTINGSKIYGPKQTGFLFVRTGIDLEPIIYGGGQEHNLRSGTENVPGIVGLAKALEISQKIRESENRRIRKLQQYLATKLLKIGDTKLNGTNPGDKRLPNNFSISFKGLEGETLMLYLDSYNICVATGSACASQEQDPSHVLLAIGLDDETAKSTIRMTLGKQTTKKDLDYVLKVLPGIVKELRNIGV